jgi:hypothetical protein
MLIAALLATAAHAASPATLKAGLNEEAGWAQVAVKQQDNIGEVIVRHKKVSGVDCLEGVARTDAKIDAMLFAARDINTATTWSSSDLTESKALSKGGTFDYYQVLNNPFPIKDRYWFLKGTTVKTGDAVSFEWFHIDASTAWPDALAHVNETFPDALSTGDNVGAWIFAPEGDKVRVHYRVCSEAGGSVPEWAGRKAAEMTLPRNIADIVERAKGMR